MSSREDHLAGIVPIAGQKRVDYVFPWHDCLMPLNKDYYAIERAVYECAVVGCDVIWIVSDMEFQPLVKEIMGSWILDPLYMNMKNRYRETYEHRRIPIYYLPIHPKDRERRDCLAWSIIYGAGVANRFARKLSHRMETDKFWVSFPHGIHNPDALTTFRKEDSINIVKNKNVLLTHSGNSVINGTQLGFTLTKQQVDDISKNFRQMEVGHQYEDEEGNRRKRPVSESFTGRFFSLDKVFENMYGEEMIERVEVEDFHQIDTFNGYRQLMASNINLEKPEAITRYHRRKREWRKMFQD